MAGAVTSVGRWLTEAVPRGRVAAFRTLVYLFVAADLVIFTPWVRTRADVPGELYQPLLIGRILPLPTPTPLLVHTIFWVLLGAALLAATGRAPRALGWPVFLLYLEWMIIAMSYGKVDHDRFGLLVALAVLPTVGAARHGDRTRTEAGGWALRVTQIAVICTYFLAAWAKLRFGGLEWMTGSVLARAILRRGTDLADLIAGVPYLLIVAQFGIMAFELSSPVVFVLRERWRHLTIGFFYSFHLVTMATITISFAPHLIAMTSFLPLERVRPLHWLRQARSPRSAAAPPGPVDPPAPQPAGQVDDTGQVVPGRPVGP
ncbi:HTTM domain-containing protein [Micromonospora sp. CPCC 206060]|uniref:HTTM domain-containing protein n=1 Tax=Micromonospora sp. CPCC 206060 TaxID=3122406 RepID=UPI002FEE66D1